MHRMHDRPCPRPGVASPLLAAVLLAFSPAAGAVSVFAGVEPVGYLARAVGGDRVEVRVLVPPGQSPHTFEPRPRQLAALEGAELYFAVGMPFEEAWVPRLEASLTGLRVSRLAVHDHGDEHTDPHPWTDPLTAIDLARRIAADLVESDPPGRGLYQERLASLTGALESAHREMERLLAPVRGGAFVVYHPSWGALARRYGLEQLAVEDDGKSPGARHLAELITRARRAGACAVFVQPQFSRRAAQQVAAELDVPLVTLDPMQGDLPRHLVEVARTISRYMEKECPR